MVGLGAVPALLQLILISWMPETPRWLLQTGKDEQARAVLNKVFANVPEAERQTLVQGVLASVRDELLAEGKAGSERHDKNSFRDVAQDLIGIPGNKRALIIACMLQGLQQLCGFVREFSPVNFHRANDLLRTRSCTFQPPYLHWLASHHPSEPHFPSL